MQKQVLFHMPTTTLAATLCVGTQSLNKPAERMEELMEDGFLVGSVTCNQQQCLA